MLMKAALKKIQQHLILLIILTTVSITFSIQSKILNINEHLNIRVLLDETTSKSSKSFTVISSKGFNIHSSKKHNAKIKTKVKEIKIKKIENNLYLSFNGETYKRIKTREIDIKPISRVFKLNNRPYKGELKFKITDSKETLSSETFNVNEKLLIINTLNLEKYIYSVIRYEGYQSWPKDMHKVQAIASRSYASHYIQLARNRKNPNSYDIKRSNFHQTYNGTHEYKHLKEAVNETRGIVLTSKNRPIVAMFDACCGGAIPANMENTDFRKAPYLARTKQCTFCKTYGLYRWKRELSLNQLLNKLKQNKKTRDRAFSLGKLRNIKIMKQDKAGIVHKIKLFGSRRNICLSGQTFWQSVNDKIRSLNFKIKRYRNNIIFNGSGFGHQIGLCQRGAREMVRKGWNYKNILRFYYPKTRFAKLKKIFSRKS